jgi:hypothetical protein
MCEKIILLSNFLRRGAREREGSCFGYSRGGNPPDLNPPLNPCMVLNICLRKCVYTKRDDARKKLTLEELFSDACFPTRKVSVIIRSRAGMYKYSKYVGLRWSEHQFSVYITYASTNCPVLTKLILITTDFSRCAYACVH